MSTAVVVGGGISGLSACHYLQKSARYSKVISARASIICDCDSSSMRTGISLFNM